jgi:probable HAF family extracellular repeat protein
LVDVEVIVAGQVVIYGINKKGEIVGSSVGWPSRRNNPIGSGFLWRDGVMMDLNDLHDTNRDLYAWIAFDINDESQIAVGLKVYLPQNKSEAHGGLMSPVQP